MSGKRNRERRSSRRPETEVTEAKVLFSEVLQGMMEDLGFSVERYGYDACRSVIKECVDRAYWQAWDEFMDWVESGDSAGAELRSMMRGSRDTWGVQIVKYSLDRHA